MKIQLKRSNQLDTGIAKEPSASQMEYGELAVNYNADDIVIFIKDSDNNIRRIAQGESSDVIMSPTAPDALSGGGELKDGTLWWNTDDGRLYVYFVDASDDEQWVDASPSSSETHWRRENQILKPIAPNDSVYIGDGNIKLNVDGSISTAGDVRVGDYDSGTPIAAETGVYTSTNGSVVLNTTTASSAVITVKKDNIDQITLKSDGSISAAGDIQTGVDRGVDGTGASLESYGGVRATRPSTQATPSNATVWEGWLGTNVTSQIFADGSIDAAGSITVNGPFDYGASSKTATAVSTGAVFVQKTTSDNSSAFAAYQGANTTPVVDITGNGSITAAGDINVSGGINTSDGYGTTMNEVGFAARNDNTSASYIFRGYKGGTAVENQTININNDGSITAARNITSTRYSTAISGLSTNVNGTDYGYALTDNSSNLISGIGIDGSATFTGVVQVGETNGSSSGPDGVYIEDSGSIYAFTSGDESTAFQLNHDGGIIAEIETDGSATFAGTVDGNSGATAGVIGGKFQSNDASATTPALQTRQYITGGHNFQGRKANGTITFSVTDEGNVTIADGNNTSASTTGGAFIGNTGYFTAVRPDGSSSTVFNAYAGATPKITFTADGNATFTGTVTANGTVLTRTAGGLEYDLGERAQKVDAALSNLKTALASISDFAQLKSALTTALADI